MPLVAHSELPSFADLAASGHEVLSLDRAIHQDIRELHIGFLNMMPDAALRATERQFIRLVGSCNRIAQFFVYPFSLPELDRGSQAQAYIDKHYSDFETIRNQGLDALIITGANVANPDLRQEPFWQPLLSVIDWAEQNVSSTLCSCLATHAVLNHLHGIERQPLPGKCWGVYSHRVMAAEHPLLKGINTRFDVPHSRHNDISRTQLEAAGLQVLIESEVGGVHAAVSPDRFRLFYFQGHPEYDSQSLFKEFKRELLRHRAGERDLPPLPTRYLDEALDPLLTEYRQQLLANPEKARRLETKIIGQLDNTWGDTAKAVFNNWLGLVYQTTNLDRTKQYMTEVDRANPLGLPLGDTVKQPCKE